MCSICSELTYTDYYPKAAISFLIIPSVSCSLSRFVLTRLSRHAEAPTCPMPFSPSADSVSHSAFRLVTHGQTSDASTLCRCLSLFVSPELVIGRWALVGFSHP